MSVTVSCYYFFVIFFLVFHCLLLHVCSFCVMCAPVMLLIKSTYLLTLSGLSPQYLAHDCQLATTTGRRRLRSSNTSPHVRFKELTHVWVIDHSLLLDRVCGTTYLSINVILNLLSSSAACYWRRICYAEDSGVQWLWLLKRIINLNLHSVRHRTSNRDFGLWYSFMCVSIAVFLIIRKYS